MYVEGFANRRELGPFPRYNLGAKGSADLVGAAGRGLDSARDYDLFTVNVGLESRGAGI